MSAPDAALASWVEETIGGTISSWERPPSGGSREAYFVNVAMPSGDTVQALLRMEAGGSFTGTDINVSKEATAYTALGDAGARVPKVYGLAPGGTALLLERVAGRGDLGDGPDERQRTLEDFIDVIGDVHLIEPDSLDLPGFPRPRTPEDHARLDLEGWARLAAERVMDLDPLARYAGAWLLSHAPTAVARTSFVQGDTGPGNFVADHGRITALCDLEFSHIGDPMDDIAWMLGRAFGHDKAEALPFLERYTARTGIPVDWSSVEFYDIAVQYRCAITTSLAVSRGGGARGWPPYLFATQRYLRALATTLAPRLGIDERAPTLSETVVSTPRSCWYDAVIEALRAGAKAIPDPDAAAETRNHQILIHYLKAYDRVGPIVEAENAADLGETMHLDTEGDEFAKRVEDAGAAGDLDVARFLLRRQNRIDLLWQTLFERKAVNRSA